MISPPSLPDASAPQPRLSIAAARIAAAQIDAAPPDASLDASASPPEAAPIWPALSDDDAPRTTESPMQIPSFGLAVRTLARAARLRCPHCGGAPVLAAWDGIKGWSTVRERCTACGFRYERSDDRYFGGAMLINLLVAELLFAVSFVSAILLLWPDVPWDAMTYGGAALMVFLPAVMYPVSKVLWLAVDVLVRPVDEGELR